ncbi:MAG: choice-of-anchor J domain-containing protein, partial [Muribaculaceae bacterium]|nr:choice-of-anchor J domain-containing protein [Muribaculaceae bacterium]
MKKFNKVLTLAAFALPALGVASVVTAADKHVGSGQLEATIAPAKSSMPARVVKIDGFLYENFESVPDGESYLPEGWTAIATPGQSDDTWSAGTLGRDGTPLNGVSGYKYAYILGNRNGSSHDAWLFSPGLEMEAGTEYTIEFFTLMPPVSGDNIMEKLEVSVCSGNSAANVVELLEVIENDNDYWRYYGYKFTPEKSGTYNIGFHSISPANSNSTVIDDLKISSGPIPTFSGDTELDLGTTDTRLKQLKGVYRIDNRGNLPLEVSLLSASEGVTVEGLPITVAAADYERITITATTEEAGNYEGSLTLKTNDPTMPTVTISLTGSV